MESDSTKTGLKAAISELHNPNSPVPGAIDGPQLDMLPFGERAAEKGLAVARGRGRPPGSKNKSTEQWRDYLGARYTSPLEMLAFTVSTPVRALAEMLSCPVVEAFRLQVQAAKELAPYLHQKMPLALDVGDKGLIQLAINLNQSFAAVGPAAVPMAIEMLNSKPEENQLVTSEEIQNSKLEPSKQVEQVSETKGQNDE